jgi:rhodanese-related sulfurtransferase
MAELISLNDFRKIFDTDTEFAVIDPRQAVDFSQGHILAASSLPLAQLEQMIGPAVPKRDTPCVLCDAGLGEALEAVGLLESLGYSNLMILDGGIDAWQASGFALFSGVSVPGKAFGEYIEKECSTPVMTAAELHARQLSGARLLLIDSRTTEEHSSYCIPGAHLCAGAELVYRVPPMIDDDMDIVVHCGGRTRSIIGAQTLIDAGLERVFALENGTMAWQFEGFELEHGSKSSLPEPDSSSMMPIRAMAGQMARHWHIDRLRSIPLQAIGNRYLIDVRSEAEYQGGHIAGSLHVAGGHLLQNIDRYLVVRNSMVILIDSDRVRATTVAMWLRRMGWRRVFVFSLDDDEQDLEFGAGRVSSPLEDRDLNPADYEDSAELLRQNRAYLDWELGLLDLLAGDPAAPYYPLD